MLVYRASRTRCQCSLYQIERATYFEYILTPYSSFRFHDQLLIVGFYFIPKNFHSLLVSSSHLPVSLFWLALFPACELPGRPPANHRLLLSFFMKHFTVPSTNFFSQRIQRTNPFASAVMRDFLNGKGKDQTIANFGRFISCPIEAFNNSRLVVPQQNLAPDVFMVKKALRAAPVYPAATSSGKQIKNRTVDVPFESSSRIQPSINSQNGPRNPRYSN